MLEHEAKDLILKYILANPDKNIPGTELKKNVLPTLHLDVVELYMQRFNGHADLIITDGFGHRKHSVFLRATGLTQLLWANGGFAALQKQAQDKTKPKKSVRDFIVEIIMIGAALASILAYIYSRWHL